MAIDAKTCHEIIRVTVEMWNDKVVNDDVFIAITKREKERGHSMADFVDERTTALLETHFTTRFQSGKGGKRRSRSMGDVWLKSNNIFNPINVKTGVSGANGQPNLVSLNKLLTALLLDQIDSYYLLFVKFELGDKVTPKVFFVDLLDHLEFATFDAGPGQMMLREFAFFDAMQGGHRCSATPIINKIERLYEMLKDGHRRLIENRRDSLTLFEKMINDYKTRKVHVINQAGIGFANEPGKN